MIRGSRKNLSKLSARHYKRRLINDDSYKKQNVKKRKIIDTNTKISTNGQQTKIKNTVVDEDSQKLNAFNYLERNVIKNLKPLGNIRPELLDFDSTIVGQASTNMTSSISNGNCQNNFDVNSDVPSIREQPGRLAIDKNINHSQLTGLLKILRTHSCFKDLPKSARALLNTPRKVILRDVEPGKYCHFGLKQHLYQYLDQNNHDRSTSSLKVQIGIDGLPLSRSSKSEL